MVRYLNVDGFANNETLLILNALAYNAMNIGCVLMEKATGQGWSFRRYQERVLRAASRITVSARRAHVIINRAVATQWSMLFKQLYRMEPIPP